MWLQNFDNNFSTWREMNRMRREMDRLLARSPRFVNAPAFPALNVWSNAEVVLVTAEIPGIDPKDIEISVVGETLTLKGSRKPEEIGEGIQYHRRERGYGNFTRTLQLPYRIEADKVGATFDKGVLTITLPRAEADKPRKITVRPVTSTQ